MQLVAEMSPVLPVTNSQSRCTRGDGNKNNLNSFGIIKTALFVRGFKVVNNILEKKQNTYTWLKKKKKGCVILNGFQEGRKG